MNHENYKNMEKLDLTQLTTEELLIEQKKRKKNYQTLAFIVGMLIGTAVYSTIKKGFGFFTIFPLFFALLVFNSKSSYDEIKKEIQLRNSQI